MKFLIERDEEEAFQLMMQFQASPVLGKRFRIHKDLLASACDFFRKKVQETEPHIIVGQSNCPLYELDFEEYEPIAFELFVDWLYRKTLPALDGSSKARAKEQIRHYTTLYLMTESGPLRPLRTSSSTRLKRARPATTCWSTSVT